MRIVKVKNLQNASDVYRGKTIASGAYYQIQSDSELGYFSGDEKVNQDLWAIPAKIAINNGTEDLSSTDGDKWLKGNTPGTQTIEYTSAYSMKCVAVNKEITKNSTDTIDLKVVNQSGESYEYKYLWGGKVFGSNIEYGDYASFSIVDKDGFGVAAGWYTQQQFEGMGSLYVVKTYVVKQYVNPGTDNVLEAEAPGKIPVGLYLRCTYTSAGVTNNPKIFINYRLDNKD
jgi:hypothetical protein